MNQLRRPVHASLNVGARVRVSLFTHCVATHGCASASKASLWIERSPSAHETKSGDYCWLVWGALGNTAMNLITATRTVIKPVVIVIFGYGVGWSMAEFDTQQLALGTAPTVRGNQVPPLSSCEAVFRQSDLAKRLGEEFGPLITPPVLCEDELLLVVPPPPSGR